MGYPIGRLRRTGPAGRATPPHNRTQLRRDLMDDVSIARVLQRVRGAFARKPALALHEDVMARASLAGGLRTRVELPQGGVLFTDLAPALGGGGDGVSPGWLMRAGVASCLVSSIALRAADLGIVLDRLEVVVDSTSDARGLFDAAPPVPPGPVQVRLSVTVAAAGIDAQALRGLVEWADAHSPVSDALRRSVDVRLQIDAA